MIVCLLIAFLTMLPIVAYIGVTPSLSWTIAPSTTLTSMNTTVWTAFANNTYAGFGATTIIIVAVVAGLLLGVAMLTSKSIKKEEVVP